MRHSCPTLRYSASLQIIAAALVLTCDAVRGLAAPSAAFERRRAEIAENYGVDVDCAPAEFTVRKSLAGHPPPVLALDSYAALLARELFIYPETLVMRSRLKRIVLCGCLSTRGRYMSGIVDCHAGTIYLDVVRPGEGNSRWRCVAIHHELCHLLDYADDGVIYEDDEWSQLNEPFFQYGKEAQKHSDRTMLKLTNRFPGFLNRYSMTGVEEDKAEVFAHLIDNGAYVAKRAADDARLRSKVDKMKRWLAGICPEMDEAFWRSTRRVYRPGIDPAFTNDDAAAEAGGASEAVPRD